MRVMSYSCGVACSATRVIPMSKPPTVDAMVESVPLVSSPKKQRSMAMMVRMTASVLVKLMMVSFEFAEWYCMDIQNLLEWKVSKEIVKFKTLINQ
jgi:hypothetical protein